MRKKSEDLTLLSREELILRLQQVEREKLEVQQKNQELKQQVDELRRKLYNEARIVAEQWHTVEDMSVALNRRIVLADDELSKDYLSQVQDSLTLTIEWMKDYQNQLRMGPLTKGKDSGTGNKVSEKQLAEAKEQQKSAAEKTAKLLRSMQKTAKELNTANHRIEKAVKELKAVQRTAAGQAADDILKTSVAERAQAKKKRSSGRIAKNRSVNSTVEASFGSHTCKVCGGHTEILESGKLEEEILSACDSLKSLVSNTSNIHQVEICQQCGQVRIAVNEEQDLPVIPNRMLGLDSMFLSCHYLHKGLPLNSLISGIKEKYEIGNDTFSYSLHDFTRIYIKPIYDLLMNEARQAKVLVLDGTPFDCLETQGKRVSKNPQDADGEPSSSNYILGITTPATAEHQFSLYGYLPKRNFESLEKIIDDSFKFTCLVTDAHPAYDKLAQQHHAKHQNCITHLRRYLLSGFNVIDYLKQLTPVPEKQWMEIIQKDIREENDKYLIYAAFSAINKIYSFEKEIDFSLSGEALTKQILKVRKKSADLLKKADTVMQEMVKRHMTPSPNGSKLIKKKGDPFSDAAAYWYNNKSKFGVFFSEPEVPVDSNIVEQAIRPLTVLRKNICWKATVEYMEDLCMIYSVFETARKNRISDPVRDWLRPYARKLWIYCVEKKYTEEIRDGKSLEKKIISWNMQQLSNGFDFSAYNILNRKKQNQ